MRMYMHAYERTKYESSLIESAVSLRCQILMEQSKMQKEKQTEKNNQIT